MDIYIALQKAVRGFVHGSAALAARLGMSVHTLNHKVSPTYPTAWPTVEEFAEIIEATGDTAPLHALNARLHHVAFAIPHAPDASDAGTQQLVTTLREFSEFATEAATALSTPGQITGNQLNRLQREALEAIGAITVCVRPTHLDSSQRNQAVVPADAQRCGSKSSIRLAGWVGSRSSTSFKYA